MSLRTRIRRIERLESKTRSLEPLGAILLLPLGNDTWTGAVALIETGPSAGTEVRKKNEETPDQFSSRVDEIVAGSKINKPDLHVSVDERQRPAS